MLVGRRLAVVALGLLVGVAACLRPATQLLVEVSHDLRPEDVACVHVAIARQGASDAPVERWFSAADVSATPFSFGVVAPDGDATGRVELRVSAVRAGCGADTLDPAQVSTTDVRRTGFVAGQSLRVRVFLSRSCVGLACPEGSVCRGGTCVSPELPPDEPGEAANVAFVTVATYTGALGGLSGADATCTAEARAAGLDGTFVAFLAEGSASPASRLGVARGWVRVDGRVVAYEQAELEAGVLIHPILLDALGRRVLSGTAWSNARFPLPGRDVDCEAWTSAAPTAQASEGSTTETVPGSWASSPSGGVLATCEEPRHLFCFETDHTSGAPPLGPSQEGRHLFVSDPLTGAPDDVCAESARGAALAFPVHALVATTASAASDHVVLDDRPWVRMDGQVVFLDAVNVTSDLPRLPVLLDARGHAIPPDHQAETGAEDVSRLPNPVAPFGTCEDWSLGGDTTPTGPAIGLASSAGPGWFFSGYRGSCPTARRFYCLED